jgi:hypothetical protein
MEGDHMILEGIPVSELSAPVIASFSILLLLTGRLIPRFIFLDKIAETDRWRQAFEAEREARTLADQQTIDLLEATRINNLLITRIFENRVTIPSGETGASSET